MLGEDVIHLPERGPVGLASCALEGKGKLPPCLQKPTDLTGATFDRVCKRATW
jgi:hypothetical protein